MSTTEQESRQIAEQARETEWEGRTFLRELFLGKLSLPLIHPFPMDAAERPEFTRFYQAMETFLRDQVDSAAIDQTGEYPEHVIDGLRKLGAFGMKIPTEYGGLGFTVSEYCRVMQLIGSTDNNVSALLSAHQSIGVPQPLKLFGTPAQKKKYLPRCAAGAISAFALTEPHVGSDPASLSTTARRDGDDFILNGEKLWCTDGTLAELLVVMARDPQTKKISAFVVETDWPGVKVEYRCRFMGLKALANGVISFRDVRVPRENLIGDEGKGLRIALTTLNTGRLTLPAVCAGIAKQCLKIVRGWSNARQQWGLPIWKHEAVGHIIADMAATTFAMDSIWMLASQMADRGGYDIRLEAAAAKEWNTVRAWEIVDKTLQLRGGRGYETETSLAGPRRAPDPGRAHDARLPHQPDLRGLERDHAPLHGARGGRQAPRGRRRHDRSEERQPREGVGASAASSASTPSGIRRSGCGASAARRDVLGWGTLGPHLRFVERSARKLARESFHGMAVYQAKMERKQGFLFRTVDVVMELFAMSATLCRARRMYDEHHPEAEHALELADLFCRNSRRKVSRLFRELWSNDDAIKNKVAASVMGGKHAWLESGIMDMGLTEAAFQTRSLVELRSRLADGQAMGAGATG